MNLNEITYIFNINFINLKIDQYFVVILYCLNLNIFTFLILVFKIHSSFS